MRITVVKVHELHRDERPTFRLCESDGEPCDNWLPGLEHPDPEGPLDRGGFDLRSDAESFALGIDRERALFGLLAESVDDIDAERHSLDSIARINRTNRRKEKPDPLDDFGTARRIDTRQLLLAMDEPPAPIVERQRRVA